MTSVDQLGFQLCALLLGVRTTYPEGTAGAESRRVGRRTPNLM